MSAKNWERSEIWSYLGANKLGVGLPLSHGCCRKRRDSKGLVGGLAFAHFPESQFSWSNIKWAGWYLHTRQSAPQKSNPKPRKPQSFIRDTQPSCLTLVPSRRRHCLCLARQLAVQTSLKRESRIRAVIASTHQIGKNSGDPQELFSSDDLVNKLESLCIKYHSNGLPAYFSNALIIKSLGSEVRIEKEQETGLKLSGKKFPSKFLRPCHPISCLHCIWTGNSHMGIPFYFWEI